MGQTWFPHPNHFILLSILTLFFSFSCQNPSQTATPYEVQVTIPESGSRGIFNDTTVKIITISIHNAAGIQVGIGDLTKGNLLWSGNISVTEIGSLTFTAVAGDLNGFKVYSGSLDQIITEDAHTVIIPMTPALGLTLDYKFGTYVGTSNNVYSVWLESDNYLQPIYICQRLLGIPTGLAELDVLPFWHLNKYPAMDSSEVNAVTGATMKKVDFTLEVKPRAGAPRQFTIYFETDVSWENNDWFANQPATLYKADIDLDSPQASWNLSFVGWTPHSGTLTTARNLLNNPDLVSGTLQGETRFITQFKTLDGGFGDFDSRSQTNLVGSITLTR